MQSPPLGDEARAQGYIPGDALEWLPFIEGYVRTGDYKAARELSNLAYQDDSRPRKGLCHTWERIHDNGMDGRSRKTGVRDAGKPWPFEMLDRDSHAPLKKWHSELTIRSVLTL